MVSKTVHKINQFSLVPEDIAPFINWKLIILGFVNKIPSVNAGLFSALAVYRFERYFS